MIQLFIARLKHYLIILLIIIFNACSGKKTFENFDSTAWKQDKLGCQGSRKQLADNFEQIRRDLLGMSQEEIIDLLGKPDYQLLMERTQKTYGYFIEPGTQCQGEKMSSKAKSVYFRFSALNIATEVLYSEGRPFE